MTDIQKTYRNMDCIVCFYLRWLGKEICIY